MVVGCHKCLDLRIPAFHVRTPVNSAIPVHPEVAIVLQNVQNSGHLRKNQHLMPSFLIELV
jgi:hypothetical protein